MYSCLDKLNIYNRETNPKPSYVTSFKQIYICHNDYVKHKNNPVIYLACGAPLPPVSCEFRGLTLLATQTRTEDYKSHSIGDQTTSTSRCFVKVIEGEGRRLPWLIIRTAYKYVPQICRRLAVDDLLK